MNLPVTEVRAGQPWWRLEWRELWRHRYLWRLLVRKDLLAAYKQSILGPLWFVIQPVVTALLFAVVFGLLARLSPAGVPRFLFYLAATVPWTYFQSLAQGTAGSLAANTNLLGKAYFPRLIAPLAAAGVNFVHFLVNYAVFAGAYAIYLCAAAPPPAFPAWGVPAVILLAGSVSFLGLGTGLWCATASARYRDIRIALPVILRTWMFATPIIYPATLVPLAWRPLFFLNPMAGIVETHRHLLFGTPLPSPACLAIGAVVTAGIFVTGLFAFNRIQRTFVDVI